MKKICLLLFVIIIFFTVSDAALKLKGSDAPGSDPVPVLKEGVMKANNNPFVDNGVIDSFYFTYPGLKKYEKDAAAAYRKQDYNYIWTESGCVTEYAHALYVKYKMLGTEGINKTFPYGEEIEGIFIDEKVNTLSEIDTDLMLTNLFLFIVNKKIIGIDGNIVTDLGWLLPRKKLAYDDILDSLLKNPRQIDWEAKVLFPQYFKLRDHL